MKQALPQNSPTVATTVGGIYGVLVLLSFVVGGFLALWIRFHHWHPNALVSPNYMPRVSQHGAYMMHFFAVPVLTACCGNLILPWKLGKPLRFPWLNILGLLTFVVGGGLLIKVMVHHPIQSGWTFFFPLEGQLFSNLAIQCLSAVSLLAISGSLHGLVFLFSIDRQRKLQPDILHDPYVTSLYATSLIHVMSLPILVLGGIWYASDRLDLVQISYRYLSHPSVYLLITPGLGIITAVLGVACHHRLVQRFWILRGFFFVTALGYMRVLLLIFEVYFPDRIALLQNISNAVMMAAALPVIGTVILLRASIKAVNQPTQWSRVENLYALASLPILVLGAVTGLILSFQRDLTSSYFLVAHFHTIIFGIIVFAGATAIHWFGPPIFGRLFHPSTARRGFFLVTGGFVAMYLPQFVLGLQGMVRRSTTYAENMQLLNQLSTLGSVLVSIGMVLALMAWFRRS